MEDYLKAVYHLKEDLKPTTTQALSEALGVTGPSVTNMIKRLHELRLVEHTRYQGVELTPTGQKIALEVIRHHRLLELYLAETLGYTWDEVHEEAEKLEHHVSEDLEDRMDSVLGHPTHDPHGDPIPSKEGTIEREDAVEMFAVEPGIEVVVARVSDRDPEQLRYLAQLGVVPGRRIGIVGRLPFDEVLRIRVGQDEHVVGKRLGTAVWVVPAIE